MTALNAAIARSLAKMRPAPGFAATGWSGVITGELASPKNSRRMVPRRSRSGRTYMAPIKSEKAQGWLGDALRQVMGKVGLSPIEGDVSLTATIYYASRRPDLEDALLMDFLQLARIVQNDRQVKEKHIYWALDRESPRVAIEVRAV